MRTCNFFLFSCKGSCVFWGIKYYLVLHGNKATKYPPHMVETGNLQSWLVSSFYNAERDIFSYCRRGPARAAGDVHSAVERLILSLIPTQYTNENISPLVSHRVYARS